MSPKRFIDMRACISTVCDSKGDIFRKAEKTKRKHQLWILFVVRWSKYKVINLWKKNYYKQSSNGFVCNNLQSIPLSVTVILISSLKMFCMPYHSFALLIFSNANTRKKKKNCCVPLFSHRVFVCVSVCGCVYLIAVGVFRGFLVFAFVLTHMNNMTTTNDNLLTVVSLSTLDER